MRPLLPLLLATSLLLPAASADAAWRELTPYDLPAGQAAACLRVAGDHVSLLRVGADAGPGLAAELLAVAPDRSPAALASTVLGGAPLECPSVGAAPGGPAVLAAPLAGRGPVRWSVLGVGAAPQTLGTAPFSGTVPAAVAGARDGSALVAWVVAPERGPSRLMVARRSAPAEPFGRPQQVATGVAFGQPPRLAIDDAGRATLAWQADLPGGYGVTARVARAVPGAGFGAPQTLGATDPNALSLAVAGDGRALVAAADEDDRTTVWEATGGSSRFARVAFRAPADGSVAAALAPDGGAVLATVERRSIAVWRRPAGGGFGGRQTISVAVPARTSRGAGPQLGQRLWSPGLFDERGEEWLAVRLASSGRFAVTFALPAYGVAAARAEAVSGTLAGGIDGRELLGSRCRPVAKALPTVLADGTLAAIWSDDATTASVGESDTRRADGRVGVVLPGTTRPVGPLPAPVPRPVVEARVLGRALGANEPLRLRVRCANSPCTVRATAWSHGVTGPGRLSRRTFAAGAASLALARGASRTLEIPAARRGAFVSPRDGGRVRVAVTACTAGGIDLTHEVAVTKRLRGRPLPAAPRIVALDARAGAKGVRVSWRLSKPLGADAGVGLYYGGGIWLSDARPRQTRFTRWLDGGRPTRGERVELRLASALASDVATRTVAVR